MEYTNTFPTATFFAFFFIIISPSSSQVSLWSSNQFTEYRPQNVINSLLTPIIPRTECFTSADNRAGICMSKKACVSSGGISAGSCGVLGSCCIYQGSCRSVINANESYFVSPNFPNSQVDRMDPPICVFTLQRDNLFQKWPICQIRIDFDDFTLAPPYNGSCGGLTDSFVISGASNFNMSGLPETGVCGDMGGQHMYFNVDPDDTSRPLLLVMNAANERIFNRRWSIRIRQIPCRSPSKAPPGCLQYYTENEGSIESFNYKGFDRIGGLQPVSATGGLSPFDQFPGGPNGGLNGPGGFPAFNQQPMGPLNQQPLIQIAQPKYMNGLRYGVCIAQQPLVCAIKWEAEEFDLGGTRPDTSGVGVAAAGVNSGCTAHSGGGNGDQGDYILIPGASRDGINDLEFIFCGGKLNSVGEQSTSIEITSFMKPFTVFVKTDFTPGNLFNGPQNQKGFKLTYKTIPCT